MNKKYTFAALAAACTLIFTGCTNEEKNNLPTNEDQVTITAGVASGVLTRAANIISYAPANGTLTVLYGSMAAAATAQANYTFKDGKWAPNGAPLYWNDIKASSIYPFFAAAPAVPVANPVVATDQNAEGAYAASDQLIAYTNGERKKEVDFTFYHVLSQVCVNITSSNSTDPDYIDLSSATVNVKGAQAAYTLDYTGAHTDAPATATATGDANTPFTAFASGTTTREHFLVLPPQSINSGALTLTVTVGDNTYTWKSTQALTLAAGTNNVINLTVKKTGVELKPGGIKIADWDNSPAAINGDLLIKVDGTAETPDGETPAFTIMQLWKGQTAITGYPVAGAKIYTLNAGVWGTVDTPFYKDETEGADRFYALAENTEADGVTPIFDEKTLFADLVAAGPAQMKGGAIALTYQHLMTKLQVTVARETGVTVDIDDVKITTPAMKPSFTLGYDAAGSIQATADEAPEAYDLSAATEYIVAPQTLASGSTFSVTLKNGNTYNAILTKDLPLEAGKIHTLALTLKVQGVDVAVKVADWAKAIAVKKEVNIDGLTPGSGSVTEITGSDGDVLAVTYLDDKALSTNVNQTGIYTYNGAAWINTTPMYWDNITKLDPPAATDYRFVALYTPAGTPITGTEKDYLVGISAASTFGAAINFKGNNANYLNHAMSQITIKLKPGTGYAVTGNPDADNKSLAAALKNYSFALQPLAEASGTKISVKADGTAEIQLAAARSNIEVASSAFNFTLGNTFYVAPQELTDNAITLLLNSGNKYTPVKLADLENSSGEKLFGTSAKLESGKSYEITITVNEAGVSISAAITPWKSFAGSGEATPEW